MLSDLTGRLSLFTIALSFVANQQALGETTPSLGVIYPLETSPKGVIFTKSIVLNHETVVEKGSIAQILFQMPQDDDADVKNARRKKTMNLESTFSRSTNAKLLERQRPEKQLSPIQKAVLERAYTTTWQDPIKFRGFLHKIPLEKLRLVFRSPGSTNARIEPLSLPDGMFLALEDNNVKVLALEKHSRAQKAGVPIGSTLKKINGIDIEPNLRSFLELYYEQKDKAKNEKKPLLVSIQEAADKEIREISFPLPYSFSNDDFFSDL